MKNQNKIQIAFVGCGRVASHYKLLMNSKNLKNFEIIAVCDENLDKAKNLLKVLVKTFLII